MANTPKNSPKKQINVKLLLIIIVSVLVAALITSNVMLTLKVVGVFDNAAPATDAPADELPVPDVDDVSVLPENIIYGINSDGNIAVAFASAAEDSQVNTGSSTRITAQVLPEEAPQTVTWDIAWANAESEWAMDKELSEYITLDGQYVSKTSYATVTVLQPFGEQVIITVTSTEDTKKSATVTIDYLKSYTMSTDCTENFAGDITNSYVILTEGVGSIAGDLNVEWSINFTNIIQFYTQTAAAYSTTGKDFYLNNLKENSIISGSSNSKSFKLQFPSDTGLYSGSITPTSLKLQRKSISDISGWEQIMYNLLFQEEYATSFSNGQKNNINYILNIMKSKLTTPGNATSNEQPMYPYIEIKISNMGISHTYRYYFSFIISGNFPTYVDSVETDQSGGIIFGQG